MLEHLAGLTLRLPKPLLSPLAGRTRVVDEQHLDPQIQLLIRLAALTRTPETFELSVDEARAKLRTYGGMLAPTGRRLLEVEDRWFSGPGGSVGVRYYRPAACPRPRPAPALVYYHGGGFVVGDLESHDRVCRALAADAECIVIAVDYRLAPEHRFPAAVDDAVAAFRWVAESASVLGVDPKRIAVAGDSAGGNLTAVVSQLTRDDEVRPAFQLMIYPATDLTREAASFTTFERGFLLPAETIRWFYAYYLPEVAERADPRASPLLTGDLSDLPPAMIQTAGFDPLRDEGEAYAERLKSAGVAVTLRRYPSLTHGYFSMSGTVRAARTAFAEAVAALREAFAKPE